MQFSGIGDLAQSLMLRRQGAELKSHMVRLTQEISTGRTKDVSERVRGDFGPLASIQGHLGQLEAFQRVRDDLSGQMVAIQASLSAIQSSTDGFGADLIAAATLGQADVIEAKSADARALLDETVSYLNTNHNGQYLFSGDASDRKPLASSDMLMDELRLVAQTATDPADLEVKIDDWFFNAGGGFETLIYNGSDVAAQKVHISGDSAAEQPILAKDGAFRALMRGLALTELVSENVIPLSFDEATTVYNSAGQSVVEGKNALIGLGRQIGDVQAALVNEDTAANAERTAFETASSKISAVDPYDAAAELEAVQFQIETLYLLTARMSQLRLSDYLR